MPIDEKDFEVVEDTVSDFSYFYDEEEEFKRNRKIIRKYKAISVGIFIAVILIMITILGIVRMKVYGTNNILTKQEIVYLDYTRTSEEIRNYSYSIYITDIAKSLDGVANCSDSESWSYTYNIEGIRSTLSEYVNVLSNIKLPSKNKDQKDSFYLYNQELIEVLILEMNCLDSVVDKYSEFYEQSSNGNTDWSIPILNDINSEMNILATCYQECYPKK